MYNVMRMGDFYYVVNQNYIVLFFPVIVTYTEIISDCSCYRYHRSNFLLPTYQFIVVVVYT